MNDPKQNKITRPAKPIHGKTRKRRVIVRKKPTESPPVASPPSKNRRRFSNILLVLGIIIAIGLFLWSDRSRRSTANRLEEAETQINDIQTTEEVDSEVIAIEVLDKLGKHISLPTDPEPTVATIVDVDSLRLTSDFYEKASNGHHLIITEERAILYDSEIDIIIDVVPVNLDQPQAPEGGAIDALQQPPNADPEVPIVENALDLPPETEVAPAPVTP